MQRSRGREIQRQKFPTFFLEIYSPRACLHPIPISSECPFYRRSSKDEKTFGNKFCLLPIFTFFSQIHKKEGERRNTFWPLSISKADQGRKIFNLFKGFVRFEKANIIAQSNVTKWPFHELPIYLPTYLHMNTS